MILTTDICQVFAQTIFGVSRTYFLSNSASAKPTPKTSERRTNRERSEAMTTRSEKPLPLFLTLAHGGI
jgi:hypothetical protein